ncbi:uncharacterized protein LOC142574452 [Dermacentor variabilis]|uniref:uncharacterized protein LOC142574452 n=1 Tax=Dermacentor variabilis TaxID=34621 RepID=UPI003F5AFD16
MRAKLGETSVRQAIPLSRNWRLRTASFEGAVNFVALCFSWTWRSDLLIPRRIAAGHITSKILRKRCCYHMQATATAGAVPFTLAVVAERIACSPLNPCFIYRRRRIWKDCLSTSGQHLSSLFLYHHIAIYKDHRSATTRILNKYALTFRLA